MRAEQQGTGLIVNKILDQGVPIREVLEVAVEHCVVLKPAVPPFLSALVSSSRQESQAWRCWGNSLDLGVGGGKAPRG